MASRHPNKHIQKAVRDALRRGWRLLMAEGHAWGSSTARTGSATAAGISVWSTPRNPEAHAKDIKRKISACPHHR